MCAFFPVLISKRKQQQQEQATYRKMLISLSEGVGYFFDFLIVIAEQACVLSKIKTKQELTFFFIFCCK